MKFTLLTGIAIVAIQSSNLWAFPPDPQSGLRQRHNSETLVKKSKTESLTNSPTIALPSSPTIASIKRTSSYNNMEDCNDENPNSGLWYCEDATESEKTDYTQPSKTTSFEKPDNPPKGIGGSLEDNKFNTAFELLKAGKYAKALYLLPMQNPDSLYNTYGIFNKAYALYKLNRLPGAREYLEKIWVSDYLEHIELHPEHANFLGAIYNNRTEISHLLSLLPKEMAERVFIVEPEFKVSRMTIEKIKSLSTYYRIKYSENNAKVKYNFAIKNQKQFHYDTIKKIFIEASMLYELAEIQDMAVETAFRAEDYERVKNLCKTIKINNEMSTDSIRCGLYCAIVNFNEGKQQQAIEFLNKLKTLQNWKHVKFSKGESVLMNKMAKIFQQSTQKKIEEQRETEVCTHILV